MGLLWDDGSFPLLKKFCRDTNINDVFLWGEKRLVGFMSTPVSLLVTAFGEPVAHGVPCLQEFICSC